MENNMKKILKLVDFFMIKDNNVRNKIKMIIPDVTQITKIEPRDIFELNQDEIVLYFQQPKCCKHIKYRKK